MKLSKSIEILDNFYMRGYKLNTKDDYAALKLGIEALKAINSVRKGVPATIFSALPGETKE